MVATDKPRDAARAQGATDGRLTIIDHRTKKEYDVPVEHGTISALALREIKVDDDDFGLMSYDPAFKNTASTKSTITFIDGERGILEYRGFPIEQLAEKSSFLEVAYLIISGSCPPSFSWTNGCTRSPITLSCTKT